MARLEGKIAIVTGAARGTGEATARLFVEQGARVLLGDVQDELGESVAKDIGDDAAYVHLDVTSEDDWGHAVEAVQGRFGDANILVNNAGILHMSAIGDTEVSDYDRVVAVNQKGTFLGIKSIIASMTRRGGGAIVNVSSVDGKKGGTGLIAYASSKWAVRGMTRVAALELGKFGIRVNAVCPEAGSPAMLAPYMPPGIDVEKIAAYQQRILSFQKDRSIDERIRDISNTILFLASDESLSVTGTEILIDSGNAAGTIVKGTPGS